MYCHFTIKSFLEVFWKALMSTFPELKKEIDYDHLISIIRLFEAKRFSFNFKNVYDLVLHWILPHNISMVILFSYFVRLLHIPSAATLIDCRGHNIWKFSFWCLVSYIWKKRNVALREKKRLLVWDLFCVPEFAWFRCSFFAVRSLETIRECWPVFIFHTLVHNSVTIIIYL